MRAVVCHRLDGPRSLRLDELPSPALGPGRARVRVRAAAVNFADS